MAWPWSREPEPSFQRHVPLRQVAARVGELDAGRPILVICASGQRSTAAARTLVKLGFSDVYDVRGGLHAWARQGLPVKT